MEVELVDMETNGEEISNILSFRNNSNCSKEQNIGNKMSNNNAKKKANNKNCIIIIISAIILLVIIILAK